ncbi:hypothetical protein BPC006_II2877 [Burkholderia pseudomallei BPC006]|nr:hypothetical protein BPC006_II2877 [Burkholderia pseudomallei BPC006]
MLDAARAPRIPGEHVQSRTTYNTPRRTAARP